MDQVRIPSQIRGQWTAKRQDIPEEGVWFAARRTFTVRSIAPSADFWISTGGNYQLTINSNLVGCGPRPHHLPDTSYVDQYDLSKYLTDGDNVIAILYRSGPVDSKRHPGFWCQLELDGVPAVWSDNSWDLLEIKRGILAPVTLAGNNSLSLTLEREIVPVEWFRPDAALGKRWQRPDWLRTVAMPGGKIAFHPLLPNEISEEITSVPWTGGGKTCETGAASGFHFHDIYSVPGVYLAASFRFAEKTGEITAHFTSDVPFRIFSNNHLAKQGEQADDLPVTLPLNHGWNRILVYQESRLVSSGGFWRLPGEKPGANGPFLVDMLEGALPGWNLTGPLRLPLNRTAAGIRPEHLPMHPFRKRPVDTYANAGWIANLGFHNLPATELSETMRGEEFFRFRLDRLRYGLVSLEFTAPSGATVDLLTGSQVNAAGCPVYESNRRSVYSIRTCEGKNRLIMPVAAEVFEIMILVRRSSDAVRLEGVFFHEMSRLESRETSFKCSDPALNAIWDAGLQSIRRAAAFQEPVWYEAHGAKLIDQCIQAFNMISIFNDYQASRGRLVGLLESQLESGEIPVATHGRTIPAQMEQLFALPLWLLYHHRSGNDPELLSYGVQAVDRLVSLFDGLVDESTGLIQIPPGAPLWEDMFEEAPPESGTVPVAWNVCYCRMLLSAGEIYRQLSRKEEANHCFRNAVLMATRLKEVARDPATGLLARWLKADGSVDGAGDLRTNFLALLAGVHEPAAFQKIFYTYFNFTPPYAKFPEQSRSGYFNFFFLEMLFALNQGDWALRYLRDFYGQLLDPATQAWRVAPGSSEITDGRLHGGRFSVPNAFLIRQAAGLRPAGAGYNAVYFDPPINVLQFVEINLPTVKGQIHVLWRRDDNGVLHVTIDATYPLRVIPDFAPGQEVDCSFNFNENVTLDESKAVPVELNSSKG